MKRVLMRLVLALVTLAPFATAPRAEAQRNGEAYATAPAIERTDYDMRKFIAPLSLTEAELNGRKLFAQRCANCHGGTSQRPGPLLGKHTVEKLGDSAVREKIATGSAAMPGFEYSLAPAQVDQVIAFLKTFTPPRPQTTAPDG
jgi:mono/diheme cytochrome c family protein